MKSMVENGKKLRRIRQVYLLFFSVLFSIIYIPHFFAYLFCKKKKQIDEDINMALEIAHYDLWKKSKYLALLGLLHTDAYFRVVFYHRIGIVAKTLIGWYRPGNKYFQIPHNTKLGSGIGYYHPFSTILNAESIGRNFRCRNNTTIGFKDDNRRPVIGDNVVVGVNVVIIGPVSVGNNVIVGAGSVVVKDVPDNAIVAGNPAKVIRYID